MKSKKKQKEVDSQLETIYWITREALGFLKEHSPRWAKELDDASFQVFGDREVAVELLWEVLRDVKEFRRHLAAAEWVLTDFIHKHHEK